MANVLDESIQRAADCLNAFQRGKLSGTARTFPTCTERTIASDDQVITYFRYGNPAGERRHWLISACNFKSRLGSSAAVWQKHSKRERQKRKSADECSDQMNCLDRKSTRLNSSHVAISYAVFCL